eukprot:TRINITY_DN58301_c0_g1_i1.p1 TRINITY_DN58301_c0_g1~~TRINITY_DN58301_c0_g1_i1.p1  ORF type:complete len:212 (+),score=16.67 TRINITY_DN58301_c0_g1_i1:35-670(+)
MAVPRCSLMSFLRFAAAVACLQRLLAAVLPNALPLQWAPEMPKVRAWTSGDESSGRLPLGHLCVDFGMNLGGDTWLLLQAGFRVLAVEAHPLLVTRALDDPRFQSALDRGQLRIMHLGVATESESQSRNLTFWVNSHSVWSSFDKDMGCRREAGDFKCALATASVFQQQRVRRFCEGCASAPSTSKSTSRVGTWLVPRVCGTFRGSCARPI